MSVNKVILLGNVGKDPDTKLVGETKVATFSIATTERGYTTKQGKTIQDKTEWHNIVIWGALAGVVEGYVKKGTMVYVEGKLTTRSWEKDGSKQYTTEIVCDRLELLGGKQAEPKQADQLESFTDDLPW